MAAALVHRMKTLHIEFVQTKPWRGPWLLAAACLIAISWVYASQYLKLMDERKATQAQIKALLQQLVPAPVQPTVADSRNGHSLQVASALQNDLNRVFTLIEAIKEPNTRLRNLSLDTASSTVRLEYEIDSIPRASSVTLSLNAGYAEGPWRLESINSASPTTGSAAGTGQGTSQFRALWTANSARL